MGIAGRGVFILSSSFLRQDTKRNRPIPNEFENISYLCLQGFSPGSYLQSRYKIELIIYHNRYYNWKKLFYCMFRKTFLLFSLEINFIIKYKQIFPFKIMFRKYFIISNRYFQSWSFKHFFKIKEKFLFSLNMFL